MRVLSISIASCILAPMTIAAPAPPPANLIVNGGFEEGLDDIGEYKALDKGSDAIKGWKVTRGQVDLIGSFWTSIEGKRSVDLHGSPGYGGVEQTFKTKKGKRYRVELQLAVTPGAGERGIWLEAAGDRKKFDAESDEGTKEKLNWKKIEWEFTAIGDETTLEIYSTEKGDSTQGPAIDDVIVREK